MVFRGQSWLVYMIWMFLVGAAIFAIAKANWPMSLVAMVTLLSSLVPAFVADRYEVLIPVNFFSGLVVFLFATLFLGEAFDFYERFWWWDVALHAMSAMGFGLVGVILALVLFEGDRYAAPAWAIAAIAFSFALSIGALWEVFEFTMDKLFGLTMQKSGLVDTMSDLIVDSFGAMIGAASGFAYLKGRDRRGLPGLIREFVSRNRAFFRKATHRDK